ncbi:unnamed protein product [Allacma fusca]|uniref:Uncharacterized protein n=1 Tax=Allacma fusca TaxID=39272 RepID=A0A8J2KKM1_9HEXA|nr:unnamed protein product [Allacma fusca]
MCRPAPFYFASTFIYTWVGEDSSLNPIQGSSMGDVWSQVKRAFSRVRKYYWGKAEKCSPNMIRPYFFHYSVPDVKPEIQDRMSPETCIIFMCDINK